jgi:hypothetical protein
MEYKIYSDDSGSGNDRYHALCLVAVPVEYDYELQVDLACSVGFCGGRFAEWKSVTNSDSHMRSAKALLSSTVDMVDQYGVKIQTLIWDRWDSRHGVIGRDDHMNKKYMYRMALKDLVNRNSITDITWVPDHDERMDFSGIASAVTNGTLAAPRFGSIKMSHPEVYPFLQIADLQAGLWRYYYENAEEARSWYNEGMPSGCPTCGHTRSTVAKLGLIAWYVQYLQAHGVAMTKFKGLWKTTIPRYTGLNIWPYTPQHSADRAPRRRVA